MAWIAIRPLIAFNKLHFTTYTRIILSLLIIFHTIYGSQSFFPKIFRTTYTYMSLQKNVLLCDRIAILSGGKIAFIGTVEQLGETITDIQIDRGSLEQHFMKIAKGE